MVLAGFPTFYASVITVQLRTTVGFACKSLLYLRLRNDVCSVTWCNVLMCGCLIGV
jgi:hypothetical protein